MHRALRPVAAALAARLRRAAGLLALAASRRIVAAGHYISARAQDSDQRDGSDCSKRNPFHNSLPWPDPQILMISSRIRL